MSAMIGHRSIIGQDLKFRVEILANITKLLRLLKNSYSLWDPALLQQRAGNFCSKGLSLIRINQLSGVSLLF